MNPFLLTMAVISGVLVFFLWPDPPGHVLILKGIEGAGFGVVTYFSLKRVLRK